MIRVGCTIAVGDADDDTVVMQVSFSKTVLISDADEFGARVGKALQEAIERARDESLDLLTDWVHQQSESED